MQYNLLTDAADFPCLYLIDCSIDQVQLVAQLGYINAGLADREYELFNEMGYVVTVRLPKIALNLKRDVTAILNSPDSYFEVTNYGVRLH